MELRRHCRHEKGCSWTYGDLLQQGLKKGVVLGKIAKDFVILGEIDEDRKSIVGNSLTKDGGQFRYSVVQQ